MKTIKSLLILSSGIFIGSFLLFSCDSISGGKTEYTLATTVSPSDGGTITPETGKYSDGETITLTGNPNEGWRFVRWEGDWSSTENPTEITMSGDYSVTGVFERSPVFLSDNGITIMCPDAPIGTIGKVDGVEFEVVDRELLIQRRDEGSDLARVCVSNVTDMSEMFYQSEFNQPIGSWDVSNVTNMRRMFFFSSKFNQPVGDWDVGNVTDMVSMFMHSQFNQPIGDWDVSNVTHMVAMFMFSQFNHPIADWDVSNVRNMGGMFQSSPFNQPIGDWDVSKVTDIRGMFQDSPFNQPIGDWNVGNVTNMGGMFSFGAFNKTIGEWDVSNVTTMSRMFRDSPFNQPIGDWNVGNVTNMSAMFYNSPFNHPISKWCVSNITSEPVDFSINSPLTEDNKPVWGTCPE